MSDQKPIIRSTEECLDFTSSLSEEVKERLGPKTAFIMIAYSETNGGHCFHNLEGNKHFMRTLLQSELDCMTDD